MTDGVARPITTVLVPARGVDFRVVQVSGNLFVCSRENGSCCCGWEEKGRMPFANDLWASEWERRGIRSRLHLTFTGCLGPCIAGNNALLQVHGRSIWFKDLNNEALVAAVFDYAEAMLASGDVLDPPPALASHVFERYLPLPGENGATAGDSDTSRLDPVCLMDVDPATARHTLEYGGRTIAFCAPACLKQFRANPEQFAAVLGL